MKTEFLGSKSFPEGELAEIVIHPRRNFGHIYAEIECYDDRDSVYLVGVDVKKLRDLLNDILYENAQGSPNPTKQ